MTRRAKCVVCGRQDAWHSSLCEHCLLALGPEAASVGLTGERIWDIEWAAKRARLFERKRQRNTKEKTC